MRLLLCPLLNLSPLSLSDYYARQSESKIILYPRQVLVKDQLNHERKPPNTNKYYVFGAGIFSVGQMEKLSTPRLDVFLDPTSWGNIGGASR